MKLRQLLEQSNKNDTFTFIIQNVEKDEHSPFFHDVYTTTSCRPAWEWMESKWIDEYIVINKDHSPIDATGDWVHWYLNDRLKCCMITKPETLIEHYGEKQGADMIAHYARKMQKGE